LMRKSVENLRDEWGESSYCVTGNNCQHFAEDLRSEYENVRSDYWRSGSQ
jgi:hypothetical protein